MQYYIHHNNEQIGPFTEAEVKAKLASGAISPQDLVWWQGQPSWVPLSTTALAGDAPKLIPVVPGTPAAAAYAPPGTGRPTSQMAIWALVCGIVGLACGLTAIPAIILGHLGLRETKNPVIQGRGMALTGMILGYVVVAFVAIYILVVFVLFAGMAHSIKTTFDTINVQLKAAEMTNNSRVMPPSSSSSTNSADQSTPAPTNGSDTTANAPATNAPDSSTNAAPPGK